ncbi:MAG: CBS domain-containing protein [Pseudomonadota bacterium]
MHTIQQILDEKGRDVFAIAPGASVYDAIDMMADKGVGALMVMDGDTMVGVISERDYARKVILQGRSSKETKVEEIMTAEVITTDGHETVDQCLGVMTTHHIRHLPIVDEGKVIGMLSIGDLVKAKIEDQAAQIESLESYIAGN